MAKSRITSKPIQSIVQDQIDASKQKEVDFFNSEIGLGKTPSGHDEVFFKTTGSGVGFELRYYDKPKKLDLNITEENLKQVLIAVENGTLVVGTSVIKEKPTATTLFNEIVKEMDALSNDALYSPSMLNRIIRSKLNIAVSNSFIRLKDIENLLNMLDSKYTSSFHKALFREIRSWYRGFLGMDVTQ